MRFFSALDTGFFLFLLICSGTARAQVVTENLSALGSPDHNDSSDAFQADTDRRYYSQGLRFGPLSIKGVGGEGAGYTNNADQLTGGHASAAIESSANLDAKLTRRTGEIDIGLAVDSLYYPERTLQDRTNWSAILGGYEERGDHQINYRYSHDKLTQMPSDLGAMAVNQPVPYNVNSFDLNDRIRTHGKLSIIPDVRVSEFDFDEINSPNPYLHQGYRNRVTVSEGSAFRYSFVENSSLLAVLQGTEVHYTNNMFNLPTRDSNGFAGLVGYDYALPGPFQIRVLGGYQYRGYVSSAYRPINTFYAELHGVWTPNHLTQASLTVSHGLADSAFESVVTFVYTTATLRVQHKFSRSLVLNAGASIQEGGSGHTPAVFENTPLSQSSTSQLSAMFDMGADWALTRHFSLNFQNRVQNSNAIGGGRYTTDYALITIRYRL